MNAASANRGWQVWIDRGGTFTDLVALAPDGRLLTRKLLSEDPRRYADAASHGIRELLESEDPQGRIDAIRMGTTLATNALLEHRGARTGLVITRGFADALAIGYQNRPHLFRRRIDLPAPLYSAVVEADERLAADGRVLRPLGEDRLAAELSRLREAGIESLAIVFLHAYVNPAHEQRAAVLARAAGFLEVSASHAVSPLIRLVARGDTTVADAYLTPLLAGYLRRFRDSLGARHAGTRLYLMQSSGVLAEATAFRGANAVLSGPAGGLVGLARASAACGRSRLVGFDMGGTSTDVALYDGELPRRFTSLVAGVRLQTPMMDIHTVAAGGGSILRAAHGRLLVGPESAGAHPGPACYRNGGPLTVTDLNVFLGRIPATHFPRVFGPGGDQPLDAATARLGFVSLARELRDGSGEPYTPERLAEGFLEVAVEQMANAIRHVSTRQGQDAADYTLFCFGGAAGQHACRVAAALGMRAALIHPLAGVLSAWGIGLADQGVLKRRSFERPFARPALAEAATALAQLAADAAAELVSQGAPAAGIETRLHAELRAAGTETDFAIALTDYETMAAAFLQAFQARFGYAADPLQVTLAALRAEAVFAGPRPAAATGEAPAAHSPAPGGLVRAWFGGWSDVPLFDRQALSPGAILAGPAIVAEQHATTVVEPGWQASVLPGGELLLAHVAAAPRVAAAATAADPVLLELFNHRFMHVAEQMGAVLQNTAVSVNIRERLDFSCAVFDAEGALVANAPHMPVHLGSMGASVRAVIDRSRGRLRPGDAWLLNAPYAGGTHLPDITVVSPVYLAGSAAPDFFVASRAHHADIGGRTPGSMPPASTRLCEEGIVFDGFQVVTGGRLLEAELRERLSQGPWPARNPDQNVADIQAQLAANQRGASELTALAGRAGAAVVRAYLLHVQDNAEQAVREAIAGLGDGSFCYELDSGAVIRVRVAVDAASRSAEIDFTGTSAQLADNFNAPRAVCTAAVLYVFRTLVESDLPLNEGCLRPLAIVVPSGSMLAPDRQAAVVAGNVETSQCVVDALYGALGVLAASQGTMNNLTFGNDRHQYYETIAGGAGAGPGFDGASGVQTHMTNSRLTDPEVLELRFPVRLREFRYRRGSGGAGRWRGGDGLVRAIEFLEPMEVGILANRRRVPPFGLAGGLPGATGSARIERADGRVEPLAATDSARVLPGDTIVVETPGGGGYGTPAA